MVVAGKHGSGGCGTRVWGQCGGGRGQGAVGGGERYFVFLLPHILRDLAVQVGAVEG